MSYIPALDGVRGIAIVVVMLHNFSVTGGPVETGLASVFSWGWVGVQLFFVLSGFLITRILLETRQVPRAFATFMIHRALRVMPLYYAALVVYFIVVPHVADAPTVRAALPHQGWYWTYLCNWSEPLGLGAPGLGHFWSLAVEAQFYLVWPFLLLGLDRRRVGSICVAIAVIGVATSVGLRLGVPDSAQAVYKMTLTRMGAPALGGLVAVAARRPPWRRAFERHARSAALAVVALIAAIAAWRHGFSHRDAVVQGVGFTATAVLFAIWLFAIVCEMPVFGAASLAWPARPALRAIGRVSYGMYVLHYPLHWAAMKPLHGLFQSSPGLRGSALLALYSVAAMGVTYVLAVASWHLFECRVLALKRYFPTTRSTSDAPPAVSPAA